MLALAQGTVYIDEPFHRRHNSGVCYAKSRHSYLYICDENEDDGNWHAALNRTLQPRYSPIAGARAIRSLPDLGRMMRDWGRFTAARMLEYRPLMKDPLAFFSTPWIARRFDASVVLLTRHPAAFASSLARLNWTFDFSNWLDQPLLMRDLLGPWREELLKAHAQPGDVIDQACLLWKVIAGVTMRWRDEYPNWVFTTHESLSRDPLTQFQLLFDALGLPFNERVREAIVATTKSSNAHEAPANVAHSLNRDSVTNITNWKSRLTAEQISRVREAIGQAADPFYNEGEW